MFLWLTCFLPVALSVCPNLVPDVPPSHSAQCTKWLAAAAKTDGAWTGVADGTCNGGTMDAKWKTDYLQVVEAYRSLAGFTNPLSLSDLKNTKAQQCALMMDANNRLDHYPTSTWMCYTADGAASAGASNLVSAPAIKGMPIYMRDNGNPTTFGHRRWFLSNSLKEMGVGSTSAASCTQVTSSGGAAGKDWVSWPPNGTFPHTAANFDSVGWTWQSDTVSFVGSTVQVVEYSSIGGSGTIKPVGAVNVLLDGYGSRYAMSFIPTGWTMSAGKTYSVAVEASGRCLQSITYVVDCTTVPPDGSLSPTTPLPPTDSPTRAPTTDVPTKMPSREPTDVPTRMPSAAPTTRVPTAPTTRAPTPYPTAPTPYPQVACRGNSKKC